LCSIPRAVLGAEHARPDVTADAVVDRVADDCGDDEQDHHQPDIEGAGGREAARGK
jgi:hypothetical protein